MLRYLLITILLYVAAVQGGILPKLPQITNDWRKNVKVIGGQDADITDAPYQAAMLYGGGQDYRIFCGGAIIGEKLILSAAYCAESSGPTNWRIRVGSAYHVEGGQYMSVRQLIMHSKYTFERPDYDISLYILYDPINIDGVTTKIIPLPLQDETTPDFSFALFTGWGANRTQTNEVVPRLQKTIIPVVNLEVCADLYAPREVTSRMICAGNYQTGGHDFCSRDQGGPLVVDGVLVGIASWGTGCGSPGYPGVYTRVSSYVTWIEVNS